MQVRKRVCIGCNQIKHMLDGMMLCDDCRVKITLRTSPAGHPVDDSAKPKLLSYLVKTSFFDMTPEEKGEGIDSDRLSAFVKAFLETLSIEEICARFDVSSSLVNNVFQAANVRPWLHDLQIIIRGEYYAGTTIEELSKKYELSEEAVNTVLHKDFRVRMPKDMDQRRCIEMRQLYFNEHMTQANIAKIYDCSPLKVMYVCRED